MSSIDTWIVTLVFALLSACEEGTPTVLVEPICQLNQFRRCEADCGRGVEQCIEPGPRWSDCACTVLDGAPPVGDAAGLDSGGQDASDAEADADGADAHDATEAADARDAEAG
jgi:hypothetical protein